MYMYVRGRISIGKKPMRIPLSSKNAIVPWSTPQWRRKKGKSLALESITCRLNSSKANSISLDVCMRYDEKFFFVVGKCFLCLFRRRADYIIVLLCVGSSHFTFV